MMTQYHIGSLDDAGRIALMDDGGEEEEEEEEEEEKREYFLRPRSWTKALLWEKRIVSWDTRVFSFKLDHDEQTLGLPIGQHLMLRIKDPVTQEVVIRSYTPISETKKKGMMDLLIKIYFTTNTTQGGKMTMAMDKLSMGGTVEFKGPIGKFEYLGRGRAMVSGRERQVKSFCMICAGSGITPIFQVFRAVMQDPDDKTHCLVLDGNRLVEDILCKSELDDLAAGNEHRCKVLYTLTRPPEDWTGLKGRISEELIRSHVVPDDNTLILVCGPEALEKSIHGIMLAQGWKDSDVVFF
jgi:nitrate reductase (NAD(P)H)